MNSFRVSCERERRVIEYLYNEKSRLETIVTGFKRSNEEYFNKIKQTAEEKVKDVLTNGKLILKFATLSVIESLRTNPELFNFVIHDNSNNTTINYGSNYPLLMSGQQQHQLSFNAIYTAAILEEAEKLYKKLITELTSRIMAAASSTRASSLPSIGIVQKLVYKNDNAYQTEEPRYNNNQPEIYNNDQEQPNE